MCHRSILECVSLFVSLSVRVYVCVRERVREGGCVRIDIYEVILQLVVSGQIGVKSQMHFL